MGNGFEIEVWIPYGNDYRYKVYWAGDTFEAAIEQMRKAQSEGYKCIKLEWRPDVKIYNSTDNH